MTSKVHYKRMIFSDLKSDLHVKCPDYHKSIWVKNINAVRPKHDKKKQLAVGNKWVRNNFCILELSQAMPNAPTWRAAPTSSCVIIVQIITNVSFKWCQILLCR
jgi:hypothetical protein